MPLAITPEVRLLSRTLVILEVGTIESSQLIVDRIVINEGSFEVKDRVHVGELLEVKQIFLDLVALEAVVNGQFGIELGVGEGGANVLGSLLRK